MFSWFRQWNKVENRSIFDKIKAQKKPYKTKGVSFLDHPVDKIMYVSGLVVSCRAKWNLGYILSVGLIVL